MLNVEYQINFTLVNYNISVEYISKSASRALGSLLAKYYQCGGMSYSVFTKLYNSLVLPVLTYGSAIWGINKFSKLNAVQLRATKAFLGLHKTSPNNAATGDLGWPSCYAHQLGEVYRFQIRLSNMDNHRITKVIYNHFRKRKGCHSFSSTQIFKKYDIDTNFIHFRSPEAIKSQIKIVQSKVQEYEQKIWLESLWNDSRCPNGNKLRLYRLYKERLEAENYVIVNMPRYQRQILARFRSGTLPLFVETGRYQNIALEDRICKFCDQNKVEDECHALLECDLYKDLRHDLLKLMVENDDNFNEHSILVKLCLIMTLDSAQTVLAKYIHSMFKRRKLYDIF